MTLLRRDPFGELFSEFNRVTDEVNRLFQRPGVVAGPPVNVWSDEQAVYVEVDLPGFDAAKLDVQVTEGNELTIAGERPVLEIDGAVWVRQERPAGKFSRTFTLPVLVDADKVQANYEHGILKLTLPKHEAAKPRKIAVKA